MISIHALREEGDQNLWTTKKRTSQFLSTPSARRATLVANSGFVDADISIHALREEGDAKISQSATCCSMISIHALREEGDTSSKTTFWRAKNFYPRPPRGGRPIAIDFDGILCQFLSTPSARRATGQQRVLSPLRGISIHALREEGDRAEEAKKRENIISIHALREEGDSLSFASSNVSFDFYPRPPRGGRLSRSTSKVNRSVFLSTPSARRATRARGVLRLNAGISIHALREEGDPGSAPGPLSRGDFYPRPPRGGRLASRFLTPPAFQFLSTPSARRAT